MQAKVRLILIILAMFLSQAWTAERKAKIYTLISCKEEKFVGIEQKRPHIAV
jgi:hypothetical protein